jgi:hypothetical protein
MIGARIPASSIWAATDPVENRCGILKKRVSMGASSAALEKDKRYPGIRWKGKVGRAD